MASERICTTCGQIFRGRYLQCMPCRSTERACSACGRTFRSNSQARCSACRTREYECDGCGRWFCGHNRTCGPCRAQQRQCSECGRIFRGNTLTCPSCRVPERTCPDCGRIHRNTMIQCPACHDATKDPAEVAAQERRIHNVRRARKLGAQVQGPVSVKTYSLILASGPCVYCFAPAEHVDHIRPLARGGMEHRDNLVPACGHCNRSKHDLLLVEWRPDRVAHAIAASPLVAAEYERQITEMEAIAA